MKKNEVNNWFNSLTVAEASRALSASLDGSGLSNRGILLISHDNYEELRSEHMGECREISLLRLWERLSDDDKAAVQRVYLDAASHPPRTGSRWSSGTGVTGISTNSTCLAVETPLV